MGSASCSTCAGTAWAGPGSRACAPTACTFRPGAVWGAHPGVPDGGGGVFVAAGAILLYNRFRPHDPAKLYVNRLKAQAEQKSDDKSDNKEE